MPRDNFSQKTKDLLGQSVGFYCVRPGCAKPTTAFNSSTGGISSLGHAAHDSAASPGGARFEESMTPEQRKALNNGAHLCPTCARLVDIDYERFPIGTIQSWQQEAMNYRVHRMNMPHPPIGLDFKAGCEGATRFLHACQEIKFDKWQKSVTWKSLCAMEELFRSCSSMSVMNPLSAHFPHMVNLQLAMIESIRFVYREVKYSRFWSYNEYEKSYFPINIHKILPNFQEQEEIARIENSFMLVYLRMEDFFENSYQLRLITTSPYSNIDLYGW